MQVLVECNGVSYGGYVKDHNEAIADIESIIELQ